MHLNQKQGHFDCAVIHSLAAFGTVTELAETHYATRSVEYECEMF